MSAGARGVAAAEAARAGLRVFPVTPRGKTPLRKGWQRSATADVAVVQATWRDVPDANIGVACGDGLIVVDTDSAAGDAAVRELGMPATPTVRTAAGQHYYLAGTARNRTDALPDVDVRGRGGFAVGAGSIHSSGAEYRWVVAPWEAPIAAIPADLLAALAASPTLLAQQKACGDYTATVIERGTRNATLFSLACSLRGRYGFSAEEILAALLVVNRKRCQPPLHAAEIERIAKSAASYDSPPLWATDPFGFARDPALRARERILLVAIARYAKDDGVAWPGVRRLRNDTRLATDTIKRATEALAAAGFLVVERRSGTSNLYRLLDSSQRSLGSQGSNESGSSVLPSRTAAGGS